MSIEWRLNLMEFVVKEYICANGFLSRKGSLGNYIDLYCVLFIYLSLCKMPRRPPRARFVHVNLKAKTDVSSVFFFSLSELKYSLTRWLNCINCH